MSKVQLTMVQAAEIFSWESKEHGITIAVDAENKQEAIEKLKKFASDLYGDSPQIYEW